MLLLGLTGSIATGKSTVSTLLRSSPYNLPVIDADVIARKVVEPGKPAYNKIVQHFSPSTPNLLLHDEPGRVRPLNRPVLGKRVFGQGTERDRKVLNGIVHPAVRWAILRQILYYYICGHWCVVLDIPLLYESGMWEVLCGTVVVVSVYDRKVQIWRLCERDGEKGLSRTDAENRVSSQMPIGDKTERCQRRNGGQRGSGSWGVTLPNDGGQEDLRQEVHKAMTRVQRGCPRWWTWTCLLCPPVGILAGLRAMVRSWLVKQAWDKDKAKAKAKL